MADKNGIGIVLAAGQSTRFESDKRLINIQGETMLSRSLKPYLDELEKVVVVVRPQDSITDDLPECVKSVEAADSHLGMGHSLGAGIQYSVEAEADWVIVGLGDMPWVQASTINMVKTVLQSRNNVIVRPTHNEQAGNPVGFSREFFDGLSQLTGDRGARQLIGENRDKLIEFEIDDPGILRDIDYESDLEN